MLLQQDESLRDNWNDAVEPLQPLFDLILSPAGLLFSFCVIGGGSLVLLWIIVTLYRNRQAN